MTLSNFATMTKQELLAYLLENRDDQDAFYALMDKLYATQSNEKFSAPKSIEDLQNFPELIRNRQKNQDNI